MNRFLNKYAVSATWELGGTQTFTDNEVDITNDTITIVNHGYKVGDVVGATTSGTLPTGLSADTAYYIIVVDSSTVKVATSRANAFAGTNVNITGVTSGTHTFTKNAIGAILTGVVIPANHIIVDSRYDVPTTCTTSGSDAGTMAIHVESANDIVSATAVSTGTTWDNVANTVAGTPVSAATAVKTTANREVTFTLATKAFTAGKVVVYLEVVPSEAS